MVQTAIIKQDLLYPSVSPVVYAVQGDNFTRAIQILLFSGGQPITISEDCSAIIGYRKPDGTSGAYDSFSDDSGETPAYDISENSFRFFLAPEMLSEPGDVFITVKITNEEKSLHSFELILRVQKNHGLEPHSENYFKIAGTVADSGWGPNEYIGTDENGNVVSKKIEATGVSTEEKSLILSLFRNAAYTADMSETFANLEALWSGSGEVPDEPEEPDVPVVTLTSISATYSGGDVPVGTAVTDLTGIVVTARYSDGTSKAVTDYTLSGTIAEGANTITVSYGGMTTTFAVTGVAEEESPELEKDVSWDDGDGISLTSADILYGIALDNNKPNNDPPATIPIATRACYPHFDIRVEHGYKYKFEFESTSSAAQIGLQFYNEYALENYSTGTINNNIYDPGWQVSGVEIEPPEMQNNSAIVGVRLAFRKDTSNSAVDEGMITRVTITREAVA